MLRVTSSQHRTSLETFHSSDERLKDNITPISDPLEKVLNLSGNTFDWNEKSIYNGKDDVGVISRGPIGPP